VKGLLDRWNHFWYQPDSAHPLAAFRILLGGYLLIYYLSLIQHVPVLFSSEGVYVPYLIPDIAPGPAGAWVIYLATVAAYAMLTAGWKPRLAAALSLAGFLYHYFLYFALQNSSYDRLSVIYLLVLCVSDSGKVWAVGAKRDDDATVAIWTARIIRFQMIILYFGSGLWKMFNPKWETGRMMKATMTGMWASPVSREIVGLDLPMSIWHGFTQSIIYGELIWGALLFFRKTWFIGVAVGIVFHTVNTTILVIPWFLVAMVTYPFFIEPPTLRRWVDKVRGRLPGASSPS